MLVVVHNGACALAVPRGAAARARGCEKPPFFPRLPSSPTLPPSPRALAQVIGEMWRALSEAEKESWKTA